MDNKKIITDIKNEAKTFFVDASGCHDWSHIERVHNLSQKIGKEENADLDILKLASYLHDIARKQEMEVKGTFCHAEKGAEMALNLLKKYNLNNDVINNVVHCISTHRYRNNKKPETIEACVLYDSDKLDSIGAVGIARTFLFAGNAASGKMYTGNEKEIVKTGKDYSYTNEDSGYLEYEVKLKHIKNKMLTETGKKVAKERHDFMKIYFSQFFNEIEGKK
ncbi:HD domain-containing protein [Candidatus Parcubacteria bacterium]|nr:HD domain-containing protein [Candidatus Parcubacteria bacterium]